MTRHFKEVFDFIKEQSVFPDKKIIIIGKNFRTVRHFIDDIDNLFRFETVAANNMDNFPYIISRKSDTHEMNFKNGFKIIALPYNLHRLIKGYKADDIIIVNYPSLTMEESRDLFLPLSSEPRKKFGLIFL